MTSVQEILRSEDCTFYCCTNEAERDGRCRQHPLQRAAAPDTRKKWTRGEVIEAIQRWAREHDGDPPTQGDWLRRGTWWPSSSTASRACGGWGAAIEAAGFEKPTRGRGNARKRVPGALSGREPEAETDGGLPTAAASETVGEPAAARVSPSRPESSAAAVETDSKPAATDYRVANLRARLAWCAGGEWSVLVSPADAELLLEVLA